MTTIADKTWPEWWTPCVEIGPFTDRDNAESYRDQHAPGGRVLKVPDSVGWWIYAETPLRSASRL